ncbi:MAG: thymidine phosphorylase [Armatimonadota bacterium]|nr:thymidine phosphorylase [bacterium]
MRIPDIIAAKRDGKELSSKEIKGIVSGYAWGEVPDYQMSAFLMAVYIRGLSFAETSALTQAMVESGTVLNLDSITGTKVDKHSTGGVGDKTTLVVVPMLAACGLKVAKMSGRGLGFTGGTLDKLESIPGFNTALDVDRFISQVSRIGAAITGQTHGIVPADKKIYALRDVTATVESIPLIAASVMSKKIACGSDVILLDVKVGSGAFVHSIEQARELAQTMIVIGTAFGRKVSAAITDMNQPLGRAVGNALEAAEAIETLKGGGPSDLRELCVELSALMLYIAGQYTDLEDARNASISALASGSALAKFIEIINAQDGDPRVIDDPNILLQAAIVHEVKSATSGYVKAIDCARIGTAASILGAGRERKEDTIDPAVGLVVMKKLGDAVEVGEVLALIYANDPQTIPSASSAILEAYQIGELAQVPPLIYEVIH